MCSTVHSAADIVQSCPVRLHGCIITVRLHVLACTMSVFRFMNPCKLAIKRTFIHRQIFTMTNETTKLVICGGGNGAHAWSAIASSRPNTEVRVLTLTQEKALRWSDSLQKGDFTVSFYHNGNVVSQLKSKPKLVTRIPQEAVPGSDVIALVVPAFRHEQYLRAIKPYIEPGMILVGLPGQPGFEFQVREILGEVTKLCTILNMESLPWSARITEFGRSCKVLATKESLLGAIRTGSSPPKKDPQASLQSLLGEKPVLDIKGDLLSITLKLGDAFSHPPLLYDRWASWDGAPLDEQPLCYLEISEQGAADLSLMADEVLDIVKAITARSPNTDLSRVEHIFHWYKRVYANDIEDKSNLYTAITTNKAYRFLTHPMLQTDDGKWMPNFRHRYITENVPFGLVVLRGIAEIVDVKTPKIDKVIEWSQDIMKKKYLVDGKVQGEDTIETRAPQRYGFTTLKDLLE